MRLLLALVFTLVLSAFAQAKTGVVDWEHGFVNMRSQPKSSSAKVGKIDNGGQVEVFEEEGDWTKVKFAGKTGWIVTKSLTVTAEKPAPAPVVAAAEPKPVEPVAPVAPVVETPVPKPYEPPATPAPAYNAGGGGYLSEQFKSEETQPEFSVGKSIVNLLSGLLLVLGLIALVVWGVRKFFGDKLPGVQGANFIRILTTRPVNSRLSLLLVEVGGEVFLLSQSDGGIEFISRIENENALERLDYFFEFRASPFEAELRKHSKEEEDQKFGPTSKAEEIKMSIEERLGKLKRRPGNQGDQ